MHATVSKPRRRETSEFLVRTGVTLGLLGLLVLLLSPPDHVYEWGRIWGPHGYAGVFMEGLRTTALVAVLSIVLGLVLGFAGGLARISRRVWLQQVGTVYVELIRGTPLLGQIFVAYFIVGQVLHYWFDRMGLHVLARWSQESIVMGVLALGVFAGAYVTEIVRAAIQSVDKGQTEAALSQGMTPWQVQRYVIVPQALRRMIPPLAGQFVSLVKDSSLLSIIAVGELTKKASEIQSVTFRPTEVYLSLVVLYLVITFPLSRFAHYLERRLA
jgi:polar amino acid transport system permease protein